MLRSAYLGESIGPYRILSSLTAIIPWDSTKRQLMNSVAALKADHRGLAQWLEEAETLWNEHGTGGMTLSQRWNFNRALSAQFPISPLRVVYSKAGSQPAAAVLEDSKAIVENGLYWMGCKSKAEAWYLCAILNSETARSRAEHWQAEGQWGKRHFDKAMFNLPIPIFEPKNELHKELAAAAMQAEYVAARVEVKEGEYFVTTRTRIRKALAEDGIGGEIENLVEKLLGPV